MQNNGLDRRDFHKLTLAAFGGMLAGTTVGCGGGAPPGGATPAAPGVAKTSATELTEVEKLIIDEPHVCRGLNSCRASGAARTMTARASGRVRAWPMCRAAATTPARVKGAVVNCPE